MKLGRPALQQLQKRLFSPPCRQSQLLGLATTCRATFQSRRSYASISAADLQFGQPVHETHPHLLRAGESTYILKSANALLTQSCSHSRHNRSGIFRSTVKTCCKPTGQRHSNTCLLKYEVPIRSRVLRVSPRTKLFLPDRF